MAQLLILIAALSLHENNISGLPIEITEFQR